MVLLLFLVYWVVEQLRGSIARPLAGGSVLLLVLTSSLG
jgi:hypothetical protein